MANQFKKLVLSRKSAMSQRKTSLSLDKGDTAEDDDEEDELSKHWRLSTSVTSEEFEDGDSSIKGRFFPEIETVDFAWGSCSIAILFDAACRLPAKK
ncbi:hypothetical protein [Candidatus Finniella inopinata]|uniref:Uncharacterized protein n=1 Tax=Candidatus Finniella inopinata TaxID=1696036 RepID=A0A4Q7DKE8_9PROT|nr:hypothetical protein [Candidatus Finniella inopinata]RZI46860.1 hypothetical protein EQU50_01145 [Candidatus Finniella inopinata]